MDTNRWRQDREERKKKEGGEKVGIILSSQRWNAPNVARSASQSSRRSQESSSTVKIERILDAGLNAARTPSSWSTISDKDRLRFIVSYLIFLVRVGPDDSWECRHIISFPFNLARCGFRAHGPGVDN